jgi:hypothetical protein
MSVIKDIETLLAGENLPPEFVRRSSHLRQGDRSKVAFRLSGMVARPRDEVICPLMQRRNLIIASTRQAVS